MKTPAEIAANVLDSHAIKPDWRRSGEQIAALIVEAINADRIERSRYVLSFEPDAIREHFEVDEDDPTEDMTDEELLAIGENALQDDELYRVFHELLKEGVGA